jgi:hypothetical protein
MSSSLASLPIQQLASAATTGTYVRLNMIDMEYGSIDTVEQIGVSH